MDSLRVVLPNRMSTTPPEVLYQELEDETILLHLVSGEYFSLNEVGSAIWRGLHEGLHHEQLIDGILSHFEVTRDTAAADLAEFLDHLERHGLALPDQQTDEVLV